jgi:hypothetical protein
MPPTAHVLLPFGMLFFVMAMLVPLNLLTTPQTLWFAFPLIGWGSVLAGYVAYAMGLFPTKRGWDGNA